MNLTVKDLNTYSDITKWNNIRRYFGSYRKFLSSVGGDTKHCIHNYDKQILIDNYNKITSKLSTTTEKEFNKYSKIYSKNYKKEFGSWSAFLMIMNKKSLRRHINNVKTKEELIKEYKIKRDKLKRPLKTSEQSSKTLSQIRIRFGSYSDFLDAMDEKHYCKRNQVDKALLVCEYNKLKQKHKIVSCVLWKKKSKYSEHIIQKEFGSWNNFKHYCDVMNNW